MCIRDSDCTHCTGDHSLIKTVPLLVDALAKLFYVLDLVPANAILQNPILRNQLDLDQDLLSHSKGRMKCFML